MNEQFKTRYKDLTDLKSQKGLPVGKRLPLQELAKMWLLSSRATKDGDQVAIWKSGFMNREAGASKEDTSTVHETIDVDSILIDFMY